MEAKIRSLIKEAMIEKNKIKQVTYKSILENAQKIAKNDGNREMTDSDIIKAAKNEIKQLKDVYEYVERLDDSYRLSEVVDKIKYCMDILPKMASEEEILEYLNKENIEKNIGACMKALKAHFGNMLDGKMAQAVAKQYIQ